VSIVPSQSSKSLDETVAGLCLRLREGLARATRERAEELIDAFDLAMRGELGSRSFRRQISRANRERSRLLGALVRQFLREIEKNTRANVREALHNERKARKQTVATGAGGGPGTAGHRRPRRRPVRPPPPPLDPEQIKRDVETQRLRALLRPVSEEIPLPPPPPVAPPPAPVSPPPTTPGGFLRTLEKEIQDAVPFLGKLGPERCGAQIAAWTGQIRQFRDQLTPEIYSAMRPAFRIFLEHLTELRAAMEASFVDALDAKWHPPSWPDYIEANRARAEGRAARLTSDRLFAYHHAMLRALVLPHRKSVRDQAQLVIDAAAEVLPADDSLLRSAIRRHRERELRRTGEWPSSEDPQRGRWQEAGRAPSEVSPLDDEASPASDLAEPAAGLSETTDSEDADYSEVFAPASPAEIDATSKDEVDEEEADADASPSADENPAEESEFEKLWTK
jgi:hypothetical protein